LDGHRQCQSKRLPDHDDIVGERGHLVKAYGRPSHRSAAHELQRELSCARHRS
jgi:hypothetical protein